MSMSNLPLHDTPILGMVSRPPVPAAIQYGINSFWVEYPDGLVDLSRSTPLSGSPTTSPSIAKGQLDIKVDGKRTIRVDASKTALVIIDMQNFFLHPDLRSHPTGLACVDPIKNVVPGLREKGVKIVWVNWGLTDTELTTLPPSTIRGFMKSGTASSGFGAELPGGYGRVLMRGALNSALYEPLQKLYEQGEKDGTDVWIHKNRMSGIWESTHLGNYLKENGLTTLLFAGVNTDQCVLGTFIDSYYQGYDCILVQDATGTTSPTGGLENVVHNAGNSYGFVTDTKRIIDSTK